MRLTMSFQSPTIETIIACYPIITALSSYISSVDLLNLSLTEHAIYSYILQSPAIFNVLLRNTLCTGTGIRFRQTRHDSWRYITWGRPYEAKNDRDEPVEVRLYALKCDPADTLPCRRCGINVCEECRDVFRPEEVHRAWHVPATWWERRRPHLNAAWQLEAIYCLCESCDAKEEDSVRGKYLNELCDCDVQRRWICRKCRHIEKEEEREYFDKHTRFEEYDDETKAMTDHQHSRWFYCTCGNNVPEDTAPRCLWCKRRHRPEIEWYAEWLELQSTLDPMLDPDHPYWITGADGKYPNPYPQLGYARDTS